MITQEAEKIFTSMCPPSPTSKNHNYEHLRLPRYTTKPINQLMQHQVTNQHLTTELPSLHTHTQISTATMSYHEHTKPSSKPSTSTATLATRSHSSKIPSLVDVVVTMDHHWPPTYMRDHTVAMVHLPGLWVVIAQANRYESMRIRDQMKNWKC